MQEKKASMRKKMIEQLKQIPQADRKKIEQSLTHQLLETEEWQQAKTIGITISQDLEWSTEPIIRAGWQQGKKMAVPKCFPDDKLLKFYHFESYDQLEVVYYQLKEPKPEPERFIAKIKIDLLIVPGLVFDSDGYRIGFGAGYYDRFLKNYPNQTLSLASQLQIVEEIPREQHDIPVDRVIVAQS